ncbi:hypothetical protein MBANPS3_012145 [Mucor bainieri]
MRSSWFSLYRISLLHIFLIRSEIRKPLLGIVKAAALALQKKNELHTSDLKFIETSVYNWHKLLQDEVKAKRLPIKTFRPNVHYLGQIRYMTESQGLPASTSSRSIERAIGHQKPGGDGEDNDGDNGEDSDEDSDVEFGDLDVVINLQTPRKCDSTDYITLKSDDGDGSQLWSSFIKNTTITTFPTPRSTLTSHVFSRPSKLTIDRRRYSLEV